MLPEIVRNPGRQRLIAARNVSTNAVTPRLTMRDASSVYLRVVVSKLSDDALEMGKNC